MDLCKEHTNDNSGCGVLCICQQKSQLSELEMSPFLIPTPNLIYFECVLFQQSVVLLLVFVADLSRL